MTDEELGAKIESEPPPPSLRAMRMISIGATRPPPPEERKFPQILQSMGYTDDVDIEVSVTEETEELELALEAEVEVEAPVVVARSKPPPPPRSRTSDPPPPPEPAVDLSDDDVAPASSEEPDVGDDETIEELSPESIEPANRPPPPKRRQPSIPDAGEAAPPPPKRPRQTSSPAAGELEASAPKERPAGEKRRIKPWWEELFTDDFGRAMAPLTEPQVEREVAFIEESLGVAKGGVVLDLACGIGQHAVAMAARGYGVVGFDLSLPQLALAGELAQERGQKINFLQGDMREMAFEEMFDGIYCWNTSFGYFEEEKNAMVAQRAFRALRPGGSFLLDVINRDYAVAQQPSSVWFEGDACVCMDDMSVDFITSRLKVKRTLMLDDGRSRECGYSIRIYSLHELGKILHDIGFRVTEASGHPAYPGVFFGAQSPRVIILAQKP